MKSRVLTIGMAAVLVMVGGIFFPGFAAEERPHSNTTQPEDAFSEEELPFTPPEDPLTAQRVMRQTWVMASSALVIFLIVTAVALYAARAVKQPRNVTVRFVDESERGALSPFMESATEKLGSMGFGRPMDFTVPDLPQQGAFRILFTGDDGHAVLIYEIYSAQSHLNKVWLNFLEFQTVLDNGYKINTGNSPMKHSLKPVPGLVVRRCPRVTDVGELFERHKAYVEEVRSASGGRVTRQKPEDFKEQFEAEWHEVNAYQEAVGFMKPSADPTLLRGSVRLVFRTLAPETANGELDRQALGGAALGAAGILLATASMPTLIQRIGLEHWPYFACAFEAVIVALIAGAVGYASGSGGAMLGFLCYLPTAIVFESGPVGHVGPFIIALNAGPTGEKLRNRPATDVLPLPKHLSPEVYIMILFILASGIQW